MRMFKSYYGATVVVDARYAVSSRVSLAIESRF